MHCAAPWRMPDSTHATTHTRHIQVGSGLEEGPAQTPQGPPLYLKKPPGFKGIFAEQALLSSSSQERKPQQRALWTVPGCSEKRLLTK